MSGLEIAGAVLGVVGVLLMIMQHVWAWPVGMVQVAIYGWIFFTAKLYSDAILNGFFFAVLGYGWWRWWRGERIGLRRAELPVTRLSLVSSCGYAAAGVTLALAWGWLMSRTTDAALPYWDAFVLMFGLISQWLQARKHIENWPGWTLVNIVAIGVYWAKDLRVAAGLYVVFLIMGIIGWITWHRSWRATRILA